MVVGPCLVGLAKRNGPARSMSGCEALRDVAEGCVGGCLPEGWWRGSAERRPTNQNPSQPRNINEDHSSPPSTATLCQVLLSCSTVITTFPWACPSPKYRRASGTSLNG